MLLYDCAEVLRKGRTSIWSFRIVRVPILRNPLSTRCVCQIVSIRSRHRVERFQCVSIDQPLRIGRGFISE